MVTFYKYLALDKAEKSLFIIFLVSLFIFSLTLMKLPVWVCLIETPVYKVLVSNTLSNVIISLSASMTVAYVFHYVSTLHVKINQTKDLLPLASLGAVRIIKKWLLTGAQRESIHKANAIINTALNNKDGDKESVDNHITSDYSELVNDIAKFNALYSDVMDNFSFSTEVTYYLINIRNYVGEEKMRDAINQSNCAKLNSASNLSSLVRHLKQENKMLNFGLNSEHYS